MTSTQFLRAQFLGDIKQMEQYKIGFHEDFDQLLMAFLNLPSNRNLSIPGEQFNATHLAQIHAYGVISVVVNSRLQIQFLCRLKVHVITAFPLAKADIFT